jgi:ketosteroid isomerase-like protein
MRKLRVLHALAVLVIGAACGSASPQFEPGAIIALERAALDRWGKGDPQGYLESYAPDITYFDPGAERRMDGLPAMQALLLPLTGKIRVERYEMIDPKVQHDGDVAVLSYNLVSHAKRANGDSLVVRWNSTAVYQRISGTWKIIHSHWSLTKPELEQPVSEISE